MKRPPASRAAWCGLSLPPAPSSGSTAAWQQAAGADWHPRGDIVTVIGFLGDLREDWGRDRHLAQDLLARAVSELGSSQ